MTAAAIQPVLAGTAEQPVVAPVTGDPVVPIGSLNSVASAHPRKPVGTAIAYDRVIPVTTDRILDAEGADAYTVNRAPAAVEALEEALARLGRPGIFNTEVVSLDGGVALR